MFKPDEIPFPVAEDNDSLIESILSFNEDTYNEKCQTFIKNCGIIEDGIASKRVVDMIEREINVNTCLTKG